MPEIAAPRTSPRHRLAALDGLRLVAALAVLSYHYSGVFTPYWGAAPSVEFPSLNQVTRYGYLGVELFFVISGFVILMTAYDRRIEQFTASRVARLFPAYWVAIALTFCLQQLWHGGRQPSAVDALMNLTMAQGAFDIVNVQGAFWTLWIELKFYLLIGVFIVVGISTRRVLAFAVLWPLIGQVAHATHFRLLDSLLFPSYAPYFAAGMLLFLLRREGRNTTTWLALGFVWVLCIRQATGYADRAAELTHASTRALWPALAVTLMVAAVYACSHGPVSRIGWPWLTVGGALTYPLYLVHGQVGFFLIDTLHGRVHRYVILAVATVTSLVLAWLIHRLVERPFSGPLRRAVEQSLHPTDPAPEARQGDPVS